MSIQIDFLRNAAAAALTAGLTFGVIAGAAATAKADVTLTTYEQTWDATNPSAQSLQEVANDATSLSGDVDTAWQANSQVACDAIKTQIEAPREYKGDEYRGYDTVCHLAPSGTLTLGPSGTGSDGLPNLHFTYVTHNSVDFTSTQPYADKWADPRLTLSFDLTIDYSISVNVAGPDGVQPSTPLLLNAQNNRIPVKISNPQLTDVGVMAELEHTLRDIFGGNAMIQKMMDSLSKRNLSAPVTQAQLADLNSQIVQSLGAYHLTGAFAVPADQQLIFLVAKNWTPDLTGQVAARVSWQTAALPGPADCNGFLFGAKVQSGPAPIVNWQTKELGVAPYLIYSPASVTTSADNSNGTSSCETDFTSVPRNDPLIVSPYVNGGAAKSQFASMGWSLSPASRAVTANPLAYADFTLKGQIVSGTGVTNVVKVPKVDGGDPAWTKLGLGAAQQTSSTPIISLFGSPAAAINAANAANAASAASQTQQQTGSYSFKLKGLKGFHSIATTATASQLQLNQDLH